MLTNLPYCQLRARIVGNKVYYGDQANAHVLQLVREAVGDDQLVFVYDNHEKRLREDVLEFRRLVRQYKVSNRNRQCCRRGVIGVQNEDVTGGPNKNRVASHLTSQIGCRLGKRAVNRPGSGPAFRAIRHRAD
jgi:hypothetical protein